MNRPYDPNNFNEFLASQYGGFTAERRGTGGNTGGFSGSRGGAGGGGGRGGYGSGGDRGGV
jgi:hypothetical protein